MAVSVIPDSLYLAVRRKFDLLLRRHTDVSRTCLHQHLLTRIRSSVYYIHSRLSLKQKQAFLNKMIQSNRQEFFMTDKKMLRALPSKVMLPAGQSLQFDTLNESQGAQIRRQLIQHMNGRMSTYYAAHPESWKRFLDCIAD